MTPTTRCGSAARGLSRDGSTPRCSMRPAMLRSRRAGRRSSSIPMATASATSTSSRTRQSMRARTSVSCRAPAPTRSCRIRATARFGTRSACLPGLRDFCASTPRPGFPRSITFRSPDMASAAVISTRTASCGVRPRTAAWSASIAASAKARSTDPMRPAITVPRALPSTAIPARASRASRPAPRPAITPGSTSTTRWVSARTFRSPPPTSTTALSRSRMGRW